MNDEIAFYHNPRTRGRIVHWMLEEVGAPYRIVLLDFAKREHKAKEYLDVNPMGKVPAIVHRGVAVTEASAICAYLADAFPAAGLAPALDDPQRGAYMRWLFFGASSVEYAMVDRMLGRPPAADSGTIGYGSYDDVVAVLEKALTPGPWLLGDRFSAADVYVGSQIGFGLMRNVPGRERLPGFDPRPAFTAYVERNAERPAFQRAVAQNGTAEVTR